MKPSFAKIAAAFLAALCVVVCAGAHAAPMDCEWTTAARSPEGQFRAYAMERLAACPATSESGVPAPLYAARQVNLAECIRDDAVGVAGGASLSVISGRSASIPGALTLLVAGLVVLLVYRDRGWLFAAAVRAYAAGEAGVQSLPRAAARLAGFTVMRMAPTGAVQACLGGDGGDLRSPERHYAGLLRRLGAEPSDAAAAFSPDESMTVPAVSCSRRAAGTFLFAFIARDAGPDGSQTGRPAGAGFTRPGCLRRCGRGGAARVVRLSKDSGGVLNPMGERGSMRLNRLADLYRGNPAMLAGVPGKPRTSDRRLCCSA